MRTLCCALLLASAPLGCSSKPPIACSARGSTLRLNGIGDLVPFDDACSYSVATHRDPDCGQVYDITIDMKAYPERQPHEIGLVFTVTSLGSPGSYTRDASQLCTAGGYYTMTGDWSRGGTMVTDRIWTAPGEPDALDLPAFQEITVNGSVIAGMEAAGGIDLALTAN